MEAKRKETYTFGPIAQVELKIPYPDVDMQKLAKAIALHETSDCTAGVGRYNNCFGFRGSSGFYHFQTKEASYDKFYEMWPVKYGGAPDMAAATKWVCGPSWPVGKDCPGGGSPSGWLSSVRGIYATL